MAEIKLKAGVLTVDDMTDLDGFFNSADEIYSLRINLFDDKSNKFKNLKILDFIADNASKFCANGLQDVNLIINYERLPKEIFEILAKFDKKVGQSLKCKVCVNHKYEDDRGFKDSEEVKWSVGAIVKANTQIDKVCDFIKKNKFSPLEALAFIHTYVGNVEKYTESHMFNHDWYNKDQFFAGIFEELPQVVCAGYSSLEKEIIDNLNMPGLACELANVQFEREGDYSTCRHTRCYITVKDDKYGINQSCYDDATWDSHKNDELCYAHFAMSNKCHDRELNNRYDYYIPHFEYIDKDTAAYTVADDYNPSQREYDIGKNKLDQKTIEKIYFSVLQKSYKSKNFEEIYDNLEKIAANSYK